MEDYSLNEQNENVFHWYKHTDSFNITHNPVAWFNLAYEKEYSQNHRKSRMEKLPERNGY